MTRLDVPREVYEKVRLSPGRFLVVAGHERGDRLVAGAGTYSVVAVRAAAAPVPAAG